ncbi:MAG: N4-gp56 family major capsid protein [Hyphomicrobiaceae bacterium]|nr:MAG: N4-gp56 family major capsid protein [Hyphomicrobiaceae bacterium]
MSMQFKNPTGGTPSTIGTQIQNHYYVKKALVELPKLQYFSQLADVTSMPKNFGKKIKRYHYMPLLDDRNVNDQGLDASGATIANGNLYGSSKDIGTITQKMPALSETGGRVNRVGFKRIELEGTLEKFGFFDEYTQESMDFDTDEQLMEHINREMILGANEMTEDALQIDLINSAGVVRYAGAATSNATIDDTSVVTYGDLMRVSIQLDQNRCPKQTKVITGSRMIDTKTIPSGRVAYIGSELIPTFKAMKDLHNNPAFIGVERYGNATVTLNGEIGTVDQFRLVVVPEMMKWAGAGADASGTSTCYETGNKYDVFPILVVGDESFTTIGFQTDGKSVKFKIMHKAPGEATANQLDPYGETGFMSIKWYYGFMCLRPERIALIKTVGKL